MSLGGNQVVTEMCIVWHTSYMMYIIDMDIYDYTTVGGKNLIKDYIDSLDESNKIIALSIRKAIRKDGILAFQGIKTRQLKGKYTR